MGSDSDAGTSLAELMAIFLVLADIPIVLLAILVDPLYAVALAAIFVFGGTLAWYLNRRLHALESTSGEEATASETDPVAELQRRYAAGELSESAFEAKLDRLLESDERASRARPDRDEDVVEIPE